MADPQSVEPESLKPEPVEPMEPMEPMEPESTEATDPEPASPQEKDLPELKAPELPKEARTPRKIEPVEGNRHRSYNVEVCRSHLLYLGHRNSKESNDIKCDFIRFLLGFVWNFFGWHSTHALLRRKDLRQN